MATKSGTLDVGSERTSLLLFDESDSQAGQRWSGYNAGSEIVWLGDSAVEVGEGIPIPPGAWGRETLMPGDSLYGIAEAETQLNIKQDGV